ncbi:MAG TPA: hypothetical protein VHX61_19400 [Rhizomicrobium sp.]|jgi:hypothetical protein|nr:hypothetical protein [Rhizomicrobium sp.]
MLHSNAVRQFGIPASHPAARSRAEIISRYRRFRAISKTHANGAFQYMAREVFCDQARRLGIANGKTFILDNIDELAFANDLALYGRQGARKRPLDRYAAAQCFPSDSAEALVLQAMLGARFVLIRVERYHPAAGLMVTDLARNEEFWLLDEGLEKTAPPGWRAATRVYAPEDFFMTSGISIPLDGALLRGALASRPHLLDSDMEEAINDRRFAEALYREAIQSGATDRIRFQDVEEARESDA